MKQPDNIIDFTIQKVKSQIETKKALYEESFFKIFMNMENLLNKKQHENALNMVCPFLATTLLESNPKIVDAWLSDYLKENPKYLDFLRNMPDDSSKIDFILYQKVKSFSLDLKNMGFAEALNKHQVFYFTLEQAYSALPASVPFALIRYLSGINKI